MGDYISREAAKDVCKKYKGRGYVWTKIHSDICQLPASDVVERKWIPVKYRPMDEEEREYWLEQFGYDVEYDEDIMFDCPMPDDGQEILVSYKSWVSQDRCEIDDGYGLEGNGDWEGVTAWMPLPEPYKGEQ